MEERFLADWKPDFLKWAGIEEDKLDENQKKLCLMVDAHRRARNKADRETCKQIRQELCDMEHRDLADLLQNDMHITALVSVAKKSRF